MLAIAPRRRPPLDLEFQPASLWNRAFQKRVAESSHPRPFSLVLERPNGGLSRYDCLVFEASHPASSLNGRFAERLLKSLLWLKGGFRVRVGGAPEIATQLAALYRPKGERAFDQQFLGQTIYNRPFEIVSAEINTLPGERPAGLPVGRHFDGCRIGFDLGGSSRKAVALKDGKVVYSSEVAWDPCFQPDPTYHLQGIEDSLRGAAAHLPRVDAIGGSAAGTYVDNEVRAASLFRGVSDELFAKRIRGMFVEIGKRWGAVPLVVMNDGEVSALAGSITLGATSLLATSMGTSQAGGFVTAKGGLSSWFNELAFVPIDHRPDGPRDEWSGDIGCGAQYLSQQGVARLAERAGFPFPESMPLPERSLAVQAAMRRADPRAAQIYESIGVYLGYAVAHYADHYPFRHLVVSGGVTSGPGGQRILEHATDVLQGEFPELAEAITCHLPEEKDKRLGQAIAAASLPSILKAGRPIADPPRRP